MARDHHSQDNHTLRNHIQGHHPTNKPSHFPGQCIKDSHTQDHQPTKAQYPRDNTS